jgi:hypothetical protein
VAGWETLDPRGPCALGVVEAIRIFAVTDREILPMTAGATLVFLDEPARGNWLKEPTRRPWERLVPRRVTRVVLIG